MPINVSLPGALQPYAGGRRVVVLPARCATVEQVLDALRTGSPGAVDRVLTEQGELRQHVNIFVGTQNIRFAEGLATPVADGDTIEVIAAVSGG